MNKKESTLPDDARVSAIVKVSATGIAANLVLSILKALAGVFSGSIAIVLDAVNNLSDALSSVITIIGTKLAGKRPDADHPLGHGRIEYLTAMLVAALILYAGITAFFESVKKLSAPVKADYSTLSIIIVAASIAVKLILGNHVRKKGVEYNSSSLEASGKDALFDAALSASVLVCALLSITLGVFLEAPVGLAISIFIIRSGIEMMREALDDVLGHRVSGDLTSAIKKTICREPEVCGAYDLILHSYGPENYIGSVHIEIPDTMTADKIDVLSRRIAARVYEKHGIVLTGIGIYSMNTKDDKVRNLRTEINRFIMSKDGVLQIHGFYADMANKMISLDIILDFALADRDKTFNEIVLDLKKSFPEYGFRVTMDLDV